MTTMGNPTRSRRSPQRAPGRRPVQRVIVTASRASQTSMRPSTVHGGPPSSVVWIRTSGRPRIASARCQRTRRRSTAGSGVTAFSPRGRGLGPAGCAGREELEEEGGAPAVRPPSPEQLAAIIATATADPIARNVAAGCRTAVGPRRRGPGRFWCLVTGLSWRCTGSPRGHRSTASRSSSDRCCT